MSEFDEDIERLTDEIEANLTLPHRIEPRLGDVIQQLGRKKLLLAAKKDENFDIEPVHELSDSTRRYLNVLQVEKLYKCRACYGHDQTKRCWFHQKYLFTKDMKQHADEYSQFLNTQMGIVSFVELYYTYLAVPDWVLVGRFVLHDLTGCFTIAELLGHYGHEFEPDVDKCSVEIMDQD
ncbi:ORF18 [Leucania separata nucleopolyhedrovirus]|uniref:ORF18 n=1 Tax=Leucania separata nucleopolyhedrovirus TaxID=1307956 RepID=Q0ILA1_NPVLS|nr:ORF18 [Leucania separata nucleopolyhedrovirus]AAR28782.1 ORF18 [Leucania separata nucleopolyhedrovirus]